MRLKKLEVLSKDELNKINESTLILLEEVGINVDSEEARKLFLEHGVEIDDKTGNVKIPASLVKEQLKNVPDSFSLYGPDGEFSIKVGGDNINFSTQGAPTKIFDEKNPQLTRDASLEDLRNFIKIVDSLEYISSSHLDLWPVDIPYITLHCHAIKEWLKNSHKPFGMGCRGKNMSNDLMHLVSLIVDGKEELLKNPRLVGFFNPLSPLTLPKVLLGGFFVFAQHKQPIIIAPAASGGLNAPITLAGLLTQTNAEVLSSIVLTQLINPRTPVFYGTVNTPIDPRTGVVAWGSIETSLITIASAQLARFYNIPSRASGGITNSNTFDMQNGFEKFNTLSAAAYAGINYITCAGTYECGLAISLELLTIDNEMAGMVSRGLKGVLVNDDTIALEQIKTVATNKNPSSLFLGMQHTAKNIRKELFIPNLSERNTRNNWLKKGAPDIISKARKSVKRILENHEEYAIDSILEKKIDDYIKEVKKRNINEYKM